MSANISKSSKKVRKFRRPLSLGASAVDGIGAPLIGILILVIQEIRVLISGDNVGTVGREEDATGAACAAGAVASGEAIAVDTNTGGDEPFSFPSSSTYSGCGSRKDPNGVEVGLLIWFE